MLGLPEAAYGAPSLCPSSELGQGTEEAGPAAESPVGCGVTACPMCTRGGDCCLNIRGAQCLATGKTCLSGQEQLPGGRCAYLEDVGGSVSRVTLGYGVRSAVASEGGRFSRCECSWMT